MTWGEQNTEAEGHEQMDYALDQGVNFWDTAEMYAVPGRSETQGSTERIIGTWFRQSNKRDQVVLATKVTGPSPGITWLRDPIDFSKKSIMTAVEGSLQRLQTDYIDLYQVHWPERKTNFFGQRGYRHIAEDTWEDNMLEVLEAMTDLVKEGKIRHFGLSNETSWGFQNYLKLSEKHGLTKVQSIQNPYSLLNRLFEVGNAEIAIREKAGLLAYSPMAFGLLSGKYHNGSNVDKGRLTLFGDKMTRYNSKQCYDATQMYIDLAKEWKISIAQMCLAFITDQAFVTANIIGATTMSQLKENIDSADITLTKEQRKAIDKVQELIPNPAP